MYPLGVFARNQWRALQARAHTTVNGAGKCPNLSVVVVPVFRHCAVVLM